MAIDWQAFCELVARHDRFVLTSHVRPDADAIGSEIGLAELLEAQGKSVRIVNPSPITKGLTFLDPDGRVEAIHRCLGQFSERLFQRHQIGFDQAAARQGNAIG